MSPSDRFQKIIRPQVADDQSTICGWCGHPMRPEHAHYRCGYCGQRDSCCDDGKQPVIVEKPHDALGMGYLD